MEDDEEYKKFLDEEERILQWAEDRRQEILKDD